jgi:hypothetical protein
MPEHTFMHAHTNKHTHTHVLTHTGTLHPHTIKHCTHTHTKKNTTPLQHHTPHTHNYTHTNTHSIMSTAGRVLQRDLPRCNEPAICQEKHTNQIYICLLTHPGPAAEYKTQILQVVFAINISTDTPWPLCTP